MTRRIPQLGKAYLRMLSLQAAELCHNQFLGVGGVILPLGGNRLFVSCVAKEILVFDCNLGRVVVSGTFRSAAGRMSRMRRRRSAHRWAITMPGSIVFPRPTSSARMAPFASGERIAHRAASTWCGLRSTLALAIGSTWNLSAEEFLCFLPDFPKAVLIRCPARHRSTDSRFHYYVDYRFNREWAFEQASEDNFFTKRTIWSRNVGDIQWQLKTTDATIATPW